MKRKVTKTISQADLERMKNEGARVGRTIPSKKPRPEPDPYRGMKELIEQNRQQTQSVIAAIERLSVPAAPNPVARIDREPQSPLAIQRPIKKIRVTNIQRDSEGFIQDLDMDIEREAVN